MNISRASHPLVHVLFLCLVIFGAFSAAAPWPNTHGVLFAGAGLLMMVFRPVAALPRSWWWLALGFCVAASSAFLPVSLTGVPAWRAGLEALGLRLGNFQAVQPRLAAEMLAVHVFTLLAALWLAGHRPSTEGLKRWTVGFALVVALYAVLSLWKQGLPRLDGRTETFGFFPNRNHTATLLAMGAVAGIASLAQAIRDKRWWWLALAVVVTAVCLWAVLAGSESRAGLLLVGVGGIGWWLLMGKSYLGPHAWKAVVLIGLAVVGGFLIADSRIKDRIQTTAERLREVPGVAADSDSPGGAGKTPAPGGRASRWREFDLRIPIWADTIKMIADQPLTGIGAGNFRSVAPQYRDATVAANHAEAVHPESDWLWVAAEMGVPAAAILAVGIALAAGGALRQAPRHRARALRAGCVIAALLVPIHGIFDVPGHRIPLAWAAAFLFSLALPVPETGHIRRPWAWPHRVLGLIAFAAGVWLLIHGRSENAPAVALGHVAQIEVRQLDQEDQAAQAAAEAKGVPYEPKPEDDLLEQAVRQLDDALEVVPLDRSLWYLKGYLSLNFEDRAESVDRSFQIERALDPHRVVVAMRQARAWAPIDPVRTSRLWAEALRRAGLIDVQNSGAPSWRDRTLEEMRQMARGNAELEAELARLAAAE